MKIRDCMKRNVFFLPAAATVGQAAVLFVSRRIGLLPVVDEQRRPIGLLGLRDMLNLALPTFAQLITDVDFVHDFGAVESAQPAAEALAQPVTRLMHPATTVPEDCGLLRAYVLMRQRDLHDLPVVDSTGRLVGIASRVDVATAVLASWNLAEVGQP